MIWWRRLRRRRRVGPDWYRENGRIQAGFHWGGVVVARVKGRTASYIVAGSPKALDCTCDARQLPCPHVLAVQLEWEEKSEGFLDLGAGVASLPGNEKAAITELVESHLHSRPGRILEVLEKDGLRGLASA